MRATALRFEPVTGARPADGILAQIRAALAAGALNVAGYRLGIDHQIGHPKGFKQ